jgi:hypothetical protein
MVRSIRNAIGCSENALNAPEVRMKLLCIVNLDVYWKPSSLVTKQRSQM